MKRIISRLTSSQKNLAIRIICGIILLIIGNLAVGSVENLPIYIRLAIFILPYIVVSYDVILGAFRNIIVGEVFGEELLMLIATVGAFVLGEYTEANAVMLFFQVGELFQSYAVNDSRRSIASLMDIRPDTASVLRGGKAEVLEVSEVEVGEVIVIRPGERIGLDAVVTYGESAVDTSALTGESLPRDVAVGDELISGCVNISGLLHAKVTKSADESTVARILEMVENASSKKAKAENFITKFARYYTPAVVLSAVLLALLPILLFGGSPATWIRRALIFLVISCPCALVISVPLSFFGAIGCASRRGILVKGGNYLESLADADTVVFDKTGTLTRGEFAVTEVNAVGIEREKLLEFAAAVELNLSHPIAKSIVAASTVRPSEADIGDVNEYPGEGATAVYCGRTVACGNARLMKRLGVGIRNSESPKVTAESRNYGTEVYCSVDGRYAGSISLSDLPKDNAADAVRRLRSLGVKSTLMLTGDRRNVGERIARELGIDEARCELLPEDKVDALDAIIGAKTSGSTVYVGDGVNDAPVLRRADVGIAMGGLGSDAAIEAADVVLMDDDPAKLCDALLIARKTRTIVAQNIVFALVVKVGFLVLTAFGLSNMWLAVFADVGVAVLAILNAMRTARYDSKK